MPTFAPFEPAALSNHIRTLASDEFEGREPGTKGESLTIRYVREQFAAAGLKPGGDGQQWTQTVPLRRFTLRSAKVSFRNLHSTNELRRDVDWAGVSLAGRSDVEFNNAPIVFVGYGVTAPERGWDDYKGIDLHGKVAVFLINDPGFEATAPNQFAGKPMTYYGRWSYKFEEAARRGAVAALIVHEDAPASYGWATVRNSWGAQQFDIQRDARRATHPLFEGWLQRDAAVRLFRQAGLQFDQVKQQATRANFSPVVLKDTFASIAARVQINSVISHNVIGQLPGSARTGESVIYSAHWDHLGIATPDASGDRIYNGAVDNASGVAGLLELARVFAREPPTARSLIFIAFTGEEKNLLGSKFYVEHPLRPLEKTAAVFNMDMLNPRGPACDVQTWGAKQNTLADDLSKAARNEGRLLKQDSELQAGYFFRSDHFPFAQKGVPAITIGSGRTLYAGGQETGNRTHDDYIGHHYHQPSDEWSADWDLRGEALDLRLLHDTGRAIAESTSWPQWFDVSEFKAVRSASSATRELAATKREPNPAPIDVIACERVHQLSGESGSSITAELVAAGEFRLKSGERIDLPGFCRVRGVATPTSDSRIAFEIWLPSSAAWNGRFYQHGEGGGGGVINYGALASLLRDGNIVAATDDGHAQRNPFDYGWLLHHPEKLVDSAYRGLHITTLNAKQVIETYFGKKRYFSYFEGCSGGGGYAMQAAQRFPEDWDGVLVGAPANNVTGYFASKASDALRWLNPKTRIPSSKLALIQSTALASCTVDAHVIEGVATDPRLCTFDPAVLRCGAAESKECLTEGQVDSLRKIYAGIRVARTGEEVYPGFPPTSERFWQGAITSNPDSPPWAVSAANAFYRYFVFGNPAYDLRTLNFDRDLARADDKWVAGARLKDVVNANDTDLSRLRNKGGKLMMYFGWSDPYLTPHEGIKYYKNVARSMGGVDGVQEFFRLYMVPGMEHCLEGAGANAFGQIPYLGAPALSNDPDHNILRALEAWVESGVKPDRIVAVKYLDDQPTKGTVFTRPLCPYPAIPAYKGFGDSRDAANFECKAGGW